MLTTNEIHILAKQIKAEHAAVRDAARRGIAHALRCGDLLLEEKDKLPHGWIPWLEKDCGVAQRTAQLYMRLARNRAQIESKIEPKYATIADLTLNEADKLIRDRQVVDWQAKYDEETYHQADERVTTPPGANVVNINDGVHRFNVVSSTLEPNPAAAIAG